MSDLSNTARDFSETTKTDRAHGKSAADVYEPDLADKSTAADLALDSFKGDHLAVFDGTDDWTVPARIANQRYFVQIDHENVHTMIQAFESLDSVMRSEGIGHLISRKTARSMFGREVGVGQIAMLTYKGRPIVVIKPGRYWNWSWTHAWVGRGNYDLTRNTAVKGLTFAQVGQSEAMVCLDPSNQVFIVRNGGFAAYGVNGNYKVVEVVDTLNLGQQYAVYERENDEGDQTRILGYKKEVTLPNQNTIATFFNVPAQNTVVIQNGGHLKALAAGQHVITNPRATFRGFFTLGERQRSFWTQPAYTLEGVPVVLHVNLRYRVVDAIQLTKSYETPFQALKNPAQSAVNAVVSRLSYQQFMRAKKIQGDVPDVEFQNWLEAFKQECMEDLAIHAIEYGVKVLSFDVLNRRLEGKLGDDLEKQAESVLKNQMMSTQVGLQNRINTETEQGKLQVAGVRAQQNKTEAEAAYLTASKKADAEYYKSLKEADAKSEAIRRLAQANAAANKIETDQRVQAVKQIAAAQAEAIRLEGEGYGKVDSDHARRMQLEELEKQKFGALGGKATIFVNAGGQGTSSAAGGNTTQGVSDGYAFGQGMRLGKAAV